MSRRLGAIRLDGADLDAFIYKVNKGYWTLCPGYTDLV